MSFKRRLLDIMITAPIKMLGLNRANKFSCKLAELLDPVYHVDHKGEKYYLKCPNNLVRWRAETYFTKEPETIEWIESFKENDIMFDIGANIGLYSIYAARKRSARVIAFEPESQNYALLNKNVYLNKLQDRIMCLNIALSGKDCLDYLYIPNFQTGGAVNSFGKAIDENNESFKPVFKQGILSYTLDTFLSHHRDCFPAHIKIDVDGAEPEIIKGSANTLKDKRLKTLAIEINESLPQHLELIEEIRSRGLLLSRKAHAGIFENGKYSKIFNYLFVRKE